MIYKKVLVFLLGIFIFTLGVNMISLSNVGMGSWDAATFGLSRLSGIAISICIIVLSLICLIIASILKKERLKLSSFITSIVIGLFTNLWNVILPKIVLSNLIKCYGLFFAGIAIESFGLAIYLLPSLPPNPIDYLMMTIKEKYKLNILKSKVAIDSTCIILALIFRGPIGIGTILATVMMGPGINFFYNRLNGIYKRVLNC